MWPLAADRNCQVLRLAEFAIGRPSRRTDVADGVPALEEQQSTASIILEADIG